MSVVVALHQHRRLLKLAEEIGQTWSETDLRRRLWRLGKVADSLHELTARGMSSQLYLRNLPQRYYAALQEAFDIERSYQRVREAVSDLSDTVRIELSERASEQQDRFQYRIAVAAILFGVPTIVLAFFGLEINGLTSPDLSLVLALIILIGSLVLGAAVTVGLARHVARFQKCGCRPCRRVAPQVVVVRRVDSEAASCVAMRPVGRHVDAQVDPRGDTSGHGPLRGRRCMAWSPACVRWFTQL